MGKLKLRWLLLLFLILPFTGCGGVSGPEVSQSQKAAAAKPLTEELAVVPVDKLAAAIVKKMTPEEKVGQMMIVGLEGTEVDPDTQLLLQQCHVGGIIFFSPNMANRSQVSYLIRALQSQASGLGLPLFICLDQEGGQVARMRGQMYTAPAPADLAVQDDSVAIYREAAKTAADMKSLGFNVNLAPVLDINLSHKRSYGTSAEQVTHLAAQACKAYEDQGMIFCLKHFPGIGKAQVDTHEGISTVGSSKAELLKNDFLPFKQVISQFSPENFMVMIGHVQYKDLDQMPACISPAVMNLLREDAGFQGLAITDDLNMKALTQFMPSEKAAVQEINNGMNLLLVSHKFPSKIKVYKAVLEAVKDGTIPQAVLDKAVTKIVEVKLKNLVTLRQMHRFAEMYAK